MGPRAPPRGAVTQERHRQAPRRGAGPAAGAPRAAQPGRCTSAQAEEGRLRLNSGPKDGSQGTGGGRGGDSVAVESPAPGEALKTAAGMVLPPRSSGPGMWPGDLVQGAVGTGLSPEAAPRVGGQQ